MLLNCLKCGTKLDVQAGRCSCPHCRAEWPVIGGIPRFFQVPSYYWGEVGRNEARELLVDARTRSWVEAVRARFSEGDNMTLGLLDLQRASWVSMLGLDERSVALDIGSGYGAITHSISRSVRELYSVEAIPERIEFTQERLRQEGIQNVQLIQASATALPLIENSFDLVVANGILEWVGEWDQEGDPRSAQLRFLGTIRRLLKDDGVLVIGIENRMGYGYFLGNVDHSGIRYTSLVPRRVASFMLRHSSTPHYRTQLNPKKEYRTYTYSERGYRKLLADAGFADVSGHWAEPGYNQPYRLIPLVLPQWIQEQFSDLLDHPGPLPHRSWRRQLKRVFARSTLLSLVLPEFLIFASKRPGHPNTIKAWVQHRLESNSKLEGAARDAQAISWALYTSAFGRKSIVRLGDRVSGRDVAFLKIEHGTQDTANGLEVEFANLAKVRERLQATNSRSVDVPETLGTLRIGKAAYWLESAARGTKLSRLIRRPNYFADARQVEKDFARIVGAIAELTENLNNISGIRLVDSDWLKVPEGLQIAPDLLAAIEERRYFKASSACSRSAWIQHGDLSVENVFLNRQTGRIEVFDWADLAGGFPPLYDIFSLLWSTGYLAPAQETVRFSSEEDRWIASFEAICLTDTDFARIARQRILQACERLKVQPELIPSLMVEFLLVRLHYHRGRSELSQYRIHLRLLQFCIERNCSAFGLSPVGRPSASLPTY